MRPRNRPARIRRGQPPPVNQDEFTALAFEELHRPRSHLAKDLLGGVATLAIFGVIVLYVTNSLAARCRAPRSARLGPGACSGVPAFANHADPFVTWAVAACAAVAAAGFAWYMIWGYKAHRRDDAGQGAAGAQRQ
jgi:hypothetical protein